MTCKSTTSPQPSRRHFLQRCGQQGLGISFGLSLTATALTALQATTAHAQTLSEASAVSMLPVVLSVSVPLAVVGSVLVAGASLVVVSVKAIAQGSEWVLERVSDGSRLSLRVAGQSALVAGAAVSVVVLATGWLLVSAGKALCLIPNQRGRDLLHHQPLTP